MSGPTDPTPDGCTLCELPVEGVDIADDEGNEFCCVGCRDVYAALGDIEAVELTDVRRARETDGTEPEDPPPEHEATFLEVEGMHCVTCESFIEAAATTTGGVSGAAASYVTDTVRIDHDPDEVSRRQLQDAISGLGYSAYPRDDLFASRQADHWATARLVAGIVVGMMVMMQYIVLIYPTYFEGLFYDDRTSQFLTDAMASSSGIYFFSIIGILTTIILLFTGRPILRGAYVSARQRQPNMDLLVAIAAVSAYLYSVVVTLTGGEHIYYDVTVAIIVIVTVGNHYESTLKAQATDRLSELTAVQVDEARRVIDDGYEDIPVERLCPDDRVLVRSGSRVPVDGTVVKGEASIDEAVVTGESLPVRKTPGEAVVGGSVVASGAVTVGVGADATSSVDRIAELVWNLQSGTSGIQKLADRLATIFVPVVLVLAAAVTGGYLVAGAPPTIALLTGLTVLIVSCPCALGLATPLAVAAGLRDALARSIVVFDDTVFERLRSADTVVFDKTGTLTTGDMQVLDAEIPDAVLRQAVALEERSAHPVGEAVAAASTDAAELTDGGPLADDESAPVTDETPPTAEPTNQEIKVASFQSHTRGVTGEVNGVSVAVGHPKLFSSLGWDVPDRLADRAEQARSDGHVAVLAGQNGIAEGMIVVGDELRDGWEQTLSTLKANDVEVIVLTGDDAEAAARFRNHEAVASVFAGVPPEGKAETVNRLKQTGQTVMVGDGTNDAPALAAADLGIALGGGTAMAADAADAAIVDDNLESVETVFELSRAAGSRVRGNIAWAFCYNIVAIPLAITGLLNPLFAAVAMAGSSLLVTLNSTRKLVD